jgi:hypothetical protein
MRHAMKLNYALTQWLSIGGGVNRLELEQQSYDYRSLNLRLGNEAIYLDLATVQDPLAGSNYHDATLHLPLGFQLWGVQTQIRHTHYASRLDSDEFETPLVNLRSSSSITLSGAPFSLLNLRLGAVRYRQAEMVSDVTSFGFNLRLGRSNIGNSVSDSVTYLSSGVTQSRRRSGNLHYQLWLPPFTLRGEIDYQLLPLEEVRRQMIRLGINASRSIQLEFQYSQLLAVRESFSTSLHWRHNNFTLSPRLTVDDSDRYFGHVNLSMALTPRPDRFGYRLHGRAQTATGGVAARIFLDNDNDGLWSQGEPAIAGALVRAQQHYRHARSDQEGIAWLSGLDPLLASDIVIDAGTLPDPLLPRDGGGHSVNPHASRWQLIDLPVIATGEIEGFVVIGQEGRQQPFPSAMVELIDRNGQRVARQRSATDGYFSFEEIPYGDYLVQLSAESAAGRQQQRLVIRLNLATPYATGLTLRILPP